MKIDLKKIIELFEKDFNEAETAEQGIVNAFDNLPNDFFKK